MGGGAAAAEAVAFWPEIKKLLTNLRDNSDKHISELTSLLAERDQQLAQKDQQLTDAYKTIIQLQQETIDNQKQQLTEFAIQLARKDAANPNIPQDNSANTTTLVTNSEVIPSNDAITQKREFTTRPPENTSLLKTYKSNSQQQLIASRESIKKKYMAALLSKPKMN